MKRRTVTPRVERDEVPALPPLDGDLDADEPAPATLGDATAYDDAPTDDDDVAGSAHPLTGLDPMLEGEEQDGWLEGADAAGELDVGGFDEGGDEGGGTWLESDAGAPADALDDDPVPAFASLDDGEDGPLDDRDEALEEPPPLAVEDDDEPPLDAFDALAVAAAHEPPRAFALPTPVAATASVVRTEGVVLAATLSVDRAKAFLVGEGVWSLPAGGRVARRLARSEPGELFESVAALDARVLVAATSRGRVLRSDDAGAHWEAIATLGGEEDRASIELWADRTRRDRVWARAHAGGLFRSDDGGRRWDGPIGAQPVRAAAYDAVAGLLAVTSSWPPAVLRVGADGAPATTGSLRLREPAALAAVRGELWAFAFATGPGLLSVDGGRTACDWPLLESATALAVVDADDGAPQLLAAVHDEQNDRTTLLAAGIDRAGRAKGARRWLDIETPPPRVERDVDEAQHRVEALVPLDAAGRRVLVISASSLWVVERS